MFDPITSAFISSSPPLTGLDLTGLPKRLTQAYAEIVAARIQARQPSEAIIPDKLETTLNEMRRLAAAYEAYVALLPERDNRSAAAFVSASAHQVYMLGSSSSVRAHSYLDGASISADVCAGLLFLIADAHADAAECAKRISIPSDTPSTIEQSLLIAIKMICMGRLNVVRHAPVPNVPDKLPQEDQAVAALYRELLNGVKALARRIQSRVDVAVEVGGEPPPSWYFTRVKNMCVSLVDDPYFVAGKVVSVFPGPLHLANLLIALDRDLIGSAISRVPTPNQVSDDEWWYILRRMAIRRPYLWRNHLQAISSGYLNKGTSSAISFPTGGGKSTLAELKIATSLLRQEKVVFLAPTHALVDQTVHQLKSTFRSLDFEILGDTSDEFALSDLVVLPEAIVTTPERCLMLLSVQPEAFEDLGLVVFDECHLLHPRDPEHSRRSIDAMLAVVHLALVAPSADFLMLSAMMKNTDEIAAWIEFLTARPCLPLNLPWKPTRQVRGTVVYEAQEIARLDALLKEARRASPAKSAPTATAQQLLARPFGLFGLLQTWATRSGSDYALLPLLERQHHLSSGRGQRGNWYLTPNGNHTSAVIAASAADAGLKTLIFVQSVTLVEASVKEFPKLRDVAPVKLNDEEHNWHRIAAEEMGGTQYCYGEIDDEARLVGGAVGHHSLLLREERLLHEALFRRPDGTKILVATSTLAQGMNLPSELVIIAGDSRFDPAVDKMAQLEAHELLNAAGRAGRAGENAQGVVLVVPSQVVQFDSNTGSIGAHWMTLQSIFSQSDQCLDIDDPTTVLLDQIHAGTVTNGMAAYLLSRLPPANSEGKDEPLRAIVSKSLAAFKARQRGDLEWIESRIGAAFNTRSSFHLEEDKKWLEKIAGLTGISAGALEELLVLFENADLHLSAEAAIGGLFKWLFASPTRIFEGFRPETLSGLFGSEFAKIDDEKKADFVLPVVWKLLTAWMKGVPLIEIEKLYPTKPDQKKCKHARYFVLRMIPELAFLASLPARLIAGRQIADKMEPSVMLTLSTLGAVVREGCDSPDCLAIRVAVGKSANSRVAARKIYEVARQHIQPGDPYEKFESAMIRAHAALAR